MIDKLLELHPEDHLGDSGAFASPQLQTLHRHMIDLIENYNMVGFIPLNISDEESVKDVAYQMDMVVSYFENQLPKDIYPEEQDPSEVD